MNTITINGTVWTRATTHLGTKKIRKVFILRHNHQKGKHSDIECIWWTTTKNLFKIHPGNKITVKGKLFIYRKYFSQNSYLDQTAIAVSHIKIK